MTAQPRRARRRTTPANTLPRPVAGVEAEALAAEVEEPRTTTDPVEAARARRAARRPAPSHHRQHHVTTDYTHVHRDLISVAVIGVIVIAFIVAMSFVI